MTTNPDQVPATPIYTINVTTAGTAMVDGEPIEVPAGGDIHAARLAALAEVRVKAAYRGRAVRVMAKDPDGTVWNLILELDGAITTLDRPHPTPPQQTPAPLAAPPLAPAPLPPQPWPAAPPAAALAAAEPPEEPVYVVPSAVAEHTAARALEPARPWPAVPPAPTQPAAPVPAFMQLPAPGAPYSGQQMPSWAHQQPHGQAAPALPPATPQQVPPPPAPAAPAAPDGARAWDEPMPDAYRPMLARMQAQQQTGDYDAALSTADLIEEALTALYGELHPQTVTFLGIKAWLTFARGEDWAEATEAYLHAVELRHQAHAPTEDTIRLTRDAFRVWSRLRKEDPEYARELANRLVEILDEERAARVINWIENGAPST